MRGAQSGRHASLSQLDPQPICLTLEPLIDNIEGSRRAPKFSDCEGPPRSDGVRGRAELPKEGEFSVVMAGI